MFHFKLRNLTLVTALMLLSTNFTAKEASAQSCRQVEQHVTREILSKMPPINSPNYALFWNNAIQWSHQIQQRFPSCNITRGNGNGNNMSLFQHSQRTVDRLFYSAVEADRNAHRTTMILTCRGYGLSYREEVGGCR